MQWTVTVAAAANVATARVIAMSPVAPTSGASQGFSREKPGPLRVHRPVDSSPRSAPRIQPVTVIAYFPAGRETEAIWCWASSSGSRTSSTIEKNDAGFALAVPHWMVPLESKPVANWPLAQSVETLHPVVGLDAELICGRHVEAGPCAVGRVVVVPAGPAGCGPLDDVAGDAALRQREGGVEPDRDVAVPSRRPSGRRRR